MSGVEGIVGGLKSQDLEQKLLALDRLTKHFEAENLENVEKVEKTELSKVVFNGTVTEELVSTVATLLKAPQLPLCLKAILVTGPLLTHLLTTSRPLKKFLLLILPSLIERLGDGKERVRETALNSLLACWETLFSVIKTSQLPHGEKVIDAFTASVLNGMKHKTPRIRELCVSFLLSCAKKDNQFPFSKFASPVLILAEDTNEAVREKAKDLLFNYYPTVSQESRNSLQRAMTKTIVKKSLADQLTSRLLREVHTPDPKNTVAGKHRQTASGTVIPPSLDLFQRDPIQRDPIQRDKTSVSTVSTPESRSSLRSPLQPNTTEPLNVYDGKDLQKKLGEILQPFAGKETEQNWDSREQALQRFRQILRGNATSTWPEYIISFLKGFMDPLNRTLLSVRTALVFSALNLVSDLSTLLPNGTLDAYSQHIFPTLLKCAGSTKKSQSELAHATTLSYLNATSYHLRTLTWICDTTSDKGAQTRVFGLTYLLTFLETHGKSRPQLFEKKGLQVGTEIIAKALKRSLSDANAKARELARQSFYIYREVWPTAAHDLVLLLDANLRKSLTQPSKVTTTSTTSTTSTTAGKTGKTEHPKERPKSSLRSTKLLSPLASPAQTQKLPNLPSSSRIPQPKSSLGTVRLTNRPSSAMLLGSERRSILTKEAATIRSPSSLGASRRSVVASNPISSRSASSFGINRRSVPAAPNSSRQDILSSRPALNSARSPSALGSSRKANGSTKNPTILTTSLEGNGFTYSPPRDLNEGKLPHYSGVSRIPRPTFRIDSLAPLDDICESEVGLLQTKSLLPKNRPASVMSTSSKSRPSILRPPSSMSQFSSGGSFKGSNPISFNLDVSSNKNGYSKNSEMIPSKYKESVNEPTSKVSSVNGNSLMLKRNSMNSNSASDKPIEIPPFNKAPENNIQKLIELIGSRASPADFLRLNRISRDLTSESPSFRQFWLHNECLTRLVKACLFHIQKPDISWELREPGIVLLESLIKNQGQLIDSNISEILTALVECSRNPARNASSVAEDALVAFAKNIEVHTCISTTIRFLHACLLVEKGSLPDLEDLATPTASGFLILVHAIPRLNPERLNTYKLDLDSLVSTGFSHTVSVVRHHTLSLVLAIYNMLEPGQLQVFFPRLTSAQLKLIELYLDSW